MLSYFRLSIIAMVCLYSLDNTEYAYTFFRIKLALDHASDVASVMSEITYKTNCRSIHVINKLF